eukprot:TRINITY_DN16135_c0_g1_i1.p1 TRINITY_DN16135_c0_g1~~TRINITY_DN16135_c0_g1_i1.p1  ORF type:complete len:617 (+),score=146.78 TRINITY_DN16135_c0_g1_i1:74-1924(+)
MMDSGDLTDYSIDQLRAVCLKQKTMIQGLCQELSMFKAQFLIEKTVLEGEPGCAQYLSVKRQTGTEIFCNVEEGTSKHAKYAIEAATISYLDNHIEGYRKEAKRIHSELQGELSFLTEREKTQLELELTAALGEGHSLLTDRVLVAMLLEQKEKSDENLAHIELRHEQQKQAVLTNLSDSIRRGIAIKSSTEDPKFVARISSCEGTGKLLIFRETGRYFSGAERSFASARDLRNTIGGDPPVEVSHAVAKELRESGDAICKTLSDQIQVLENMDFHNINLEIMEDEVRRYHGLRKRLGETAEKTALVEFTLQIIQTLQSGAVLEPASSSTLSRLHQCKADIAKMFGLLKNQSKTIEKGGRAVVLDSIQAWSVLVDQCLLEAKLSSLQYSREQQKHYNEVKELTRTVIDYEARCATLARRVAELNNQLSKEEKTTKPAPLPVPKDIQHNHRQRPASAPLRGFVGQASRSPSPVPHGFVDRLYTQAVQRIELRAKEERTKEAKRSKINRKTIGKEHLAEMNNRLYYTSRDRSQDIVRELESKYHSAEGRRCVPPLTKDGMSVQVAKLYSGGIKAKQEKHHTLFTKLVIDKQYKPPIEKFATEEDQNATVTRLYQPRKL